MTVNSDPSTTLLSKVIRVMRVQYNKRPLAFIAIFILLFLVYFISLSNTSAQSSHLKNGNNIAESTPVTIAKVKQGDLHIYQQGLGVVTPLNIVKVSSRVDGQLMSINFKEGQLVNKGDLLAQIDPEPFKIQLTLAQKQLKLNQMLLNTTQKALIRYQKLLKQDSISLQLVENKELQVHQYQSAVQANLAAVTNAKLKLKYAKIQAPISGRVGFRQVDVGNIVQASARKSIVTITQLDPISVVFPIPEDNLPRVIKLLASDKDIPVILYDRNLENILANGHLLASDNQIDPTTGTIKLKAEFNNTNGRLFANQFVNVKMAVENRKNVLLIPTAAIQRGVQGSFVYVVNDDQTVNVTAVKLGATQGEVTEIIAGLLLNDIVVVEGGDSLKDGAKIKVVVRQSTTGSK
jgi:multidrug efflux system membrane fusion protein